ncbi:heavy metal sensor histidine kinase [Cupriavidus gilardii]|uniref:heavy metal sensor histidine kinase n=1 Tax=Cupriavidus gilardii TaxID=82541 RepID=UPI0021BEE1BC|nr:heavy metal sensor histidine kinase [Cupriavidus gilardii]MCT9126442.1 heavy metal sensor histidine kinase [Cupriavidus gilardii]
MPRLSLTARLTALFSLTSACVLLGLGWLIFSAMDRHFADQDYALLGDNLRMVERIVAAGPSDGIAARLADAQKHHGGLLIHVQAEPNAPLFASPGFDFGAALDAVARPRKHDRDDADGMQANALEWRQNGQLYRGMVRTVRESGTGEPLRMLVGMDTEIHDHFIHAFRQSLVFYIALAALASGVLGWWAARRGLAPLRTMASRAQTVTGSKLYERMPVEAVPVEMADLAANLNAMLARLQDDFRRLSEFSSDLAHELRTPITNLMTQTQVALSQPRDAGNYRDILASNAEELQRLARMVSDMLYLAKMEHGLDLPNTEAIRIADEVRALFDFYEALAEDKAVRLDLQGDGRIQGDRLMLRRALSNLISNALRHTPPGGRIVVAVADAGDHVEVAVENDGAEIDPALLPSIFDRFSRVDKSRTRPESDSVGLGLSITRAIMLAHGGDIAVRSERGKTRFGLRFPRRAD